MIELRALGALELRAPNPKAVKTIVGQPKRLALLAYLALARPRGFQRRDKLVSLFWPEADVEHARHALRQSVYVLRGALGKRVIAGRGDEEVGIGVGALWSDVIEFETLVAQGERARALALYAGPLLEGFHAPGLAPEFDQWLELERGRLQRAAARTASELADSAAAGADASAAVEWARRAAELTPEDEGAHRRLILLLQAGGDRAGALAAWSAFTRHLEAAYELEPSSEFAALGRGLRTAPVGAAAPAVRPVVLAAERAAVPTRPPDGTSTRPAVASPGPAAASAAGDPRAEVAAALPPRDATPAAAAPEPTPAARPRRRRAAVFAALALVPLVGFGGWALRSRDSRAVGTPYRVVIMPFDTHGDGSAARYAGAIAPLLAAKLDGSPPLSALELRGPPAEPQDEQDIDDATRSLAERSGASAYITGSVELEGSRVAVSATFVALDGGGGDDGYTARVSGAASDLAGVLDRLAAQLVAAGGVGVPPALRGTDKATTGVPPALWAFVEGAAAEQAGDLRGAQRAFERAVRADSAFALADYRLSLVAGHLGDTPLGLAAARRALSHPERLGPHASLRLAARVAYASGAPALAEERYRELIAAYPADVAGLRELAELLSRLNPMRGRKATEPADLIDRALLLAPGDAELSLRAAELALKARRPDAARHRLAAADGLADPGPAAVRLRALALRSRLQGAPEWGEVLGRLRGADDSAVAAVASSLTMYLGDLPAAVDAERILTEASRPPATRANAYIALAELQMARGRLRAAAAELAAAKRASLAWAALHAGLLAATPWLPSSAASLDSIRQETGENGRALPLAGTSWARASADGVDGELRRYVLGLLGARLADSAVAFRASAALGALAEADPVARDLAATVRGLLALEQGRPSRALAELREPPYPVALDHLELSPFVSQSLGRFLRGEALLRSGEVVEARGWLASMGDASLHDVVFIAPAQLRLAELDERLGRPVHATRRLMRFVSLWRECDPELRPILADAETRLARLAGGRPPAAREATPAAAPAAY